MYMDGEEKKEKSSEVVAYNLKRENINKIKKIAIEEEEGNKSKVVNDMVEEYGNR